MKYGFVVSTSQVEEINCNLTFLKIWNVYSLMFSINSNSISHYFFKTPNTPYGFVLYTLLGLSLCYQFLCFIDWDHIKGEDFNDEKKYQLGWHGKNVAGFHKSCWKSLKKKSLSTSLYTFSCLQIRETSQQNLKFFKAQKSLLCKGQMKMLKLFKPIIIYYDIDKFSFLRKIKSISFLGYSHN